MNNYLYLSSITKQYGERVILNQIDLEIKKGDYISIVGKSGAGKSTLINILGLLDREFQGEYYYGGKRIRNKDQDSFRNIHIGLIFQQYHLLPNLTAQENVMLPYTYYKGTIDGIEDRCKTLFELFDLTKTMSRCVNTLSGGEKQRVALLRSIIHDPDIILADEPTGNLDHDNASQIQKFLKINNQNGKTIIVVTHDMQLAKEATRKLCVANGSLYEYK